MAPHTSLVILPAPGLPLYSLVTIGMDPSHYTTCSALSKEVAMVVDRL